jgi:hypothetical protein
MSLGMEYYKPMYNTLRHQENLGQPIHFVPIITNGTMSIEKRAEIMVEKVTEVTK